jgi:hypothetical protein
MAAWEYFTSQKQWEAYLKDLLKTNDKALLKAIVLIYNNQTPEEKDKGESIEDNCIGFSKIDAKEMGDIARKIKANKALTKGELAKSRNKMQKYWKQLMIISKKQVEAKRLQEQREQEQRELEAKMAEEEVAAQKEDAEKLERFRQDIEILRKCSEEEISCEYGICNECPITTGFQMRMNFN